MATSERPTWQVVAADTLAAVLRALNAQMLRLLDVLGQSDRMATAVYNATATVSLTWPGTLIESDTTAGAVSLTFPAAVTCVGYRVHAVKTAGGNTLTVNGVTVTTFAGWASTGANWRRIA